jgi:dTDP-4-dehydrorhamnose reductase
LVVSATVLILGGSGMLGHKLVQVLSPEFQVWTTVRTSAPTFTRLAVASKVRVIGCVSVDDIDSVFAAIELSKPQVIINCIGVVKQVEDSLNPIANIAVNALFPHQLFQKCKAADIRLITVSTDCVFSGARGNYSEDDLADAQDRYGRSKRLGEVDAPGCLTIRTSLVGRQLSNAYGLIEWFFSRQGTTVDGYTNALFSGVTTLKAAELITDVVLRHNELWGIRHLASEPISKYDLLTLVKRTFNLNIDINRNDSLHCDRTLNCRKFVNDTGYRIPSWTDMIEQMSLDTTIYPRYEREYASR